LLIVGANPVISHGSMMTMPDAPGRLKAVRQRGGKIVVIDPRRTETAKLASEHHFIRPGTDAAFLLAIVHTLFEEQLVTLGAATDLVNGLGTVEAIARDFTPEAVAEYCGISAPTIRRLARELAAAESAACYGRLGTCVQEFGTLASWGVDLVNILTGHLDRPGGAMFPTPAAPLAAMAKPRPFGIGQRRSRVSGQLEIRGMLPSSTMAEEILTPGEGQVRAMILIMTNPLRSAANSAQLEAAFAQLDFLVAIDIYLNETTRHAHLILPTLTPAEQANYEFLLYHLSVRNIAKWSSPAVSPPAGMPEAWHVLLRLSALFLGMSDKLLTDVDDTVFAQLVADTVKNNTLWLDLTTDEVTAKLAGRTGPERIIDMEFAKLFGAQAL
jgi:anaerobic selenocysteine-containing dehydrogenase